MSDEIKQKRREADKRWRLANRAYLAKAHREWYWKNRHLTVVREKVSVEFD